MIRVTARVMQRGRDAMGSHVSVDVRVYRLSPQLEPFFTPLYKFKILCPPGTYVEDYLHPEWAALRFTCGPPPMGAIGAAPLELRWPFVVTGPTSKATRFQIYPCRIWGIGIQPAGWAKFTSHVASDFTDLSVDGSTHPTFAQFAPILQFVQGLDGAPDLIAERINSFLLELVGGADSKIELITRLHDALRSPEVVHVAELADRIGVGMRSVERLCRRYFGFPPKLLLRRQRFLRSLARYMQAPAGGWSQALDSQYYDQAQFVRDFRSFMGMTPTEYGEMPHPILDRVGAHRMADIGATPETDLPTILRYNSAGAINDALPPRANRGLGPHDGAVTGAAQ